MRIIIVQWFGHQQTKNIKTSIATENLRGNDVTKTPSETPTVEMENTDVPASLLDNMGRISEENITDNCVRRQIAKTKYCETQGIWLNNSIVEAICRVERKSYAEVARNVKTQLLHPKSVYIVQILFQIY